MSAKSLGPRVIWARASLRSRVLLIAVVLLTAGFTAFSLVTGNALRAYMRDRVDAQLRASAQVFAALPPTVAKTGADGKMPPGLTDFSTEVLGNPVITYVDKDGVVESSIDSLAGPKRTDDASGPDLPGLDASAVAARAGRAFTTAGTSGGTRWRSIAVPRVPRVTLPGGGAVGGGAGGSVIVSASMSQVDGTVDRMWHIYETTGLGLLVVLGLAGWFAVRSGLRPLTRIEQTAAEIAAGDLSRRVPELAGPHTEMGRLATALNGMLAQVETAFAARAESEARMTRFVADASHELRTPLAGIKGLTDLHRMGAVSDREDIDATMARIARESDRLARLVEDMLLLARFDERGLGTTGDSGPALELAPTDLRTLAADALHDVRALDSTRPVALTGPGGVGAPASAPALADEARLRQVVTNLVGNAVAHTPPGTAIRIGVGTVGEDAVLEVADEGPGLTPAQTAHIFERFYRADTSRTRATGGAGLGLAIVDSLVSAHAGRVEIDSTPGRGATFRVRLPLHSELRAPACLLG
ncbi:HAMP domain-containing sensor histidine kinase [Streptomyces sp. N50]|uniref:sensor histidine kinase n=1 Tax=Streptomyces sp. N50 TaxID=3081765 RepID=UPI002962178B|nr:HAMP domain-containing sensor histidine kinase [Streptomyces sp. N50]WOX12708.1 HAMP domain-containing sensor histidine kinase [Streptomyces sp. N50]